MIAISGQKLQEGWKQLWTSRNTQSVLKCSNYKKNYLNPPHPPPKKFQLKEKLPYPPPPPQTHCKLLLAARLEFAWHESITSSDCPKRQVLCDSSMTQISLLIQQNTTEKGRKKGWPTDWWHRSCSVDWRQWTVCCRPAQPAWAWRWWSWWGWRGYQSCPWGRRWRWSWCPPGWWWRSCLAWPWTAWRRVWSWSGWSLCETHPSAETWVFISNQSTVQVTTRWTTCRERQMITGFKAQSMMQVQPDFG